MMNESASGSQKEELYGDCLMDSVGSEDSSIGPEQTSIDRSEDVGVDNTNVVLAMISDADDSNVVRSMRSDADDTKMGHSIISSDVNETSVVRSVNSEEKTKSLLSKASSNDSSLVSDDSDDGGLDEYCQMSCMDFMLVPGAKAKPKPSNQMFKYNKKGAKELNIEVKGALAMGLQSEFLNEQGTINGNPSEVQSSMSFASKFRDTISCGNAVVLRGPKMPTCNDNNQVKDDFISIMAFSDDSEDEDDESMKDKDKDNESSEEEGCDKPVISENMAVPESGVQRDLLQKQIQQQIQEQIKIQQQEEEEDDLEQQLQEQRRLLEQHHLHEEMLRQRQFHQQQQQQHYQQIMGYHQHPYQGQGYNPMYHRPVNQNQQMGLDIFNASPNNHQFTNAMNRIPMQRPQSNQISMGGQEAFEELSVSSCEANYQANAAPNPPQSSLERIVEAAHSEDESDSSMVARGSMDDESCSESVKENPSADLGQEKSSANSVKEAPSADSGQEKSASGFVNEKKSFGSVDSSPSFDGPSLKTIPREENKTPDLDPWNLQLKTIKNRIKAITEENSVDFDQASHGSETRIKAITEENSVDSDQASHSSETRIKAIKEENSVDFDQASHCSETTALVHNGNESKNEERVQNRPTPKKESNQPVSFDSVFSRRLAQKRRAARLRNQFAEERAITFASEKQYSATLHKTYSEEKPFDSPPESSGTDLKNSTGNDYAVNENLSESSDIIPPPPTETSHDPSIMDVVAAAAALALNPDFKLIPELDFENEKTEEEETENEDEFVPMPELDIEEEDTENQAPLLAVNGKGGIGGTVKSEAKVSKSVTSDSHVLSKMIPSQETDFSPQEENEPAKISPLKIKTNIDDDDVLASLVLSPINEGNTPTSNPLSPLRMARIPSPRRFSRNKFSMAQSPRNFSRPLSSGNYYNRWLGGMHIMNGQHQ